jgi:hypothetical protein
MNTKHSSVTMWTDSTELFMEYPPLIAGEDARFLIHLSDMKDFKAVTRGTLSLFSLETAPEIHFQLLRKNLPDQVYIYQLLNSISPAITR